MDEGKQSGAGLGGYVVVALITAAVVYSCTKNEKSANLSPTTVAVPEMPLVTATAAPPSPSAQPETPAIPPPPAHNYDAVEGSIYYYGAAVTEEQRKTGKQAPDMVAFRYLGRDNQGHDTLQRAGSDGDRSTITCARPCKVIHYASGATVGFDEGSVVGAAMADAQHGRLKKYTPPAIDPATVQWDKDLPQVSGQTQ